MQNQSRKSKRKNHPSNFISSHPVLMTQMTWIKVSEKVRVEAPLKKSVSRRNWRKQTLFLSIIKVEVRRNFKGI